MTNLQAKPVVQSLRDNLEQEIMELKEAGKIPTIGIIRVGCRPDDVYYENYIIKNCQNIGIEARTYLLDDNICMEDFTKILREVNEDPMVHGIMILRLLPKQLDEEELQHIIDPDKDIDCMNPSNLAKVFAGDMSGLLPCTSAAVIETLKHYKINLQGTNVVVVGRSMVVGMPLSIMLLKEDATVTICHSETRNMAEICKRSDILVAAIGKAKFIDEKFITARSIVIDVGINDAGDGKICGDVDYESVAGHVQAITPVPGGIGPVTTVILLKNAVKACRNQLLRKN